MARYGNIFQGYTPTFFTNCPLIDALCRGLQKVYIVKDDCIKKDENCNVNSGGCKEQAHVTLV